MSDNDLYVTDIVEDNGDVSVERELTDERDAGAKAIETEIAEAKASKRDIWLRPRRPIRHRRASMRTATMYQYRRSMSMMRRSCSYHMYRRVHWQRVRSM